MFKVNEEELEVRYNTQKIKNLEASLNISVMGELARNQAMLSVVLLEALFTVGLYDMKAEQNVTGKKASEYFEAVIRDIGYMELNTVIIGKLEADMGFLFRTN